jgi:hypothetical protein
MNEQNDHRESLPDRLKDDLKRVQLEQLPPNQPSFLTVVLLFAAALIVIILLAIFFLHLDKGKLFRRSTPHPTSQLHRPDYCPALLTPPYLI